MEAVAKKFDKLAFAKKSIGACEAPSNFLIAKDIKEKYRRRK